LISTHFTTPMLYFNQMAVPIFPRKAVKRIQTAPQTFLIKLMKMICVINYLRSMALPGVATGIHVKITSISRKQNKQFIEKAASYISLTACFYYHYTNSFNYFHLLHYIIKRKKIILLYDFFTF